MIPGAAVPEAAHRMGEHGRGTGDEGGHQRPRNQEEKGDDEADAGGVPCHAPADLARHDRIGKHHDHAGVTESRDVAREGPEHEPRRRTAEVGSPHGPVAVTGELFPDRPREELADPSRAIGRVLEHDACSVDHHDRGTLE